MDERTRKLTTMQKAKNPRNEIDRMFVPGKEGVWGLRSTEDSDDTSIRRLEDNIKK